VSPDLADTPPDAAARTELAAVVDEEVGRLPERYRQPLVLCYLLGRANDEAARELGCPRTTLAVRLARARELLRRRLHRRGFGTIAALPVLPSADLPSGELFASTRTAVSLLATGRPSTGPATNLANGEWTSMFFHRCKTAAAMLLAVGLLGTAGIGTRALLAQLPAPSEAVGPAPPSGQPGEEPPAEERGARKLGELVAERLAFAKTDYRAREEHFIAGRVATDSVVESAQRLLHAGLEAANSKAQRVATREEHAARMKKIVDINWARYKEGRASISDHATARYFYLDACIELEREKTR
jgi:hypothetical protein